MRSDSRFVGRYDRGRKEWVKESWESVGKTVKIHPNRFKPVEHWNNKGKFKEPLEAKQLPAQNFGRKAKWGQVFQMSSKWADWILT